MKVILKKDTPRLGPKNTILDVSDSYAINVLIKQGLATQVTKGLESKIAKEKIEKKHEQEVKNSKHLQLIQSLQDHARNHDGLLFTIKRKSDAKGHLYGAITESELVDGIYDVSGISVSLKQIEIKDQIKTVGLHNFNLLGVNGEKSISFQFEVR